MLDLVLLTKLVEIGWLKYYSIDKTTCCIIWTNS